MSAPGLSTSNYQYLSKGKHKMDFFQKEGLRKRCPTNKKRNLTFEKDSNLFTKKLIFCVNAYIYLLRLYTFLI